MAAREDHRDTRKLTTAAALIGKAEGTSFEPEQAALALKAYTELASYLNAVDSYARVDGRKRERRLLNDRRGGPTPDAEASPPVIDLRVQHARRAYRSAAPQRGRVGERVDFTL